MKQEWFIVSGR